MCSCDDEVDTEADEEESDETDADDDSDADPDKDADEDESDTGTRSPYRKWKMAVFSATNSDGSDSCASNHLRCCAAITLRTRVRSMQSGEAAAAG